MFENFKIYISDVKNPENDLKHKFYKVKYDSIEKAEDSIQLPIELKLFYEEVGYGIFYQKSNSIDRLLSPMQVKQINLKEDFYEFDPDLEVYGSDFYKDKLIFFEVNEGNYLLIDINDIQEKNAIYYFEKKIANSLREFLEKFDNEGHYFESNEI